MRKTVNERFDVARSDLQRFLYNQDGSPFQNSSERQHDSNHFDLETVTAQVLLKLEKD